MEVSWNRWLFRLSVATAGATTLSIAASQILLGVTLLTWTVTASRRVAWPAYFIPAIAFMVTTTASLLASPNMESGLPVLRKFVLFSIGPLAATFITTTKRYATFVGIVAVAASIGSLIGIVQFAGYYSDYLRIGDLDNDPVNLARITGPVGHWMTFSGQQMLVLCALLPLGRILPPRWHWTFLSLLGATILLTLTRSVWIGAAAGVVVMALYVGARPLRRLAIPLSLMVVLIPALLIQRVSISFQEEGFPPDRARLAMIDAGVGMILDHPLFGVGPNRVGTEFSRHYAGSDPDAFYSGHLHNNFLQIAAERGLLSLASLLWLLGQIARDMFRLARSPVATVRTSAVSGLSVLTAFVVAGFFEFNFGDSEVFMLFLFLVSIPYGLAGASEGTRRSGEPDLI